MHIFQLIKFMKLYASSIDTDGVLNISGFPLIGPLGIYLNPHKFFKKWSSKSSDGWFRFKMQKHLVHVVAGEESRKIFFGTRDFSMQSGYGLGLGIWGDNFVPASVNHLKPLARIDLIDELLPLIIPDLERRLDWGVKGKVNAVHILRELPMAMGVKLSLGDSIGGNHADIDSIIHNIYRLTNTFRPTAKIMPWFPRLSSIHRIWAGYGLYRIITAARTKRITQAGTHFEVLQNLVDDKASVGDCVNAIVASIVAIGHNFSNLIVWLYIHLDQDPVWKSKVLSEVHSFIQDHGIARSSNIGEQLCKITATDWLGSLRSIDLCLEEAARLHGVVALARRNIGGPVGIGDSIIDTGDYVFVSLDDVHFNKHTYPEPSDFDPKRMEGSSTANFLGFGKGLHPCPGQKLAKIISKIVATLIFYKYEVKMVDKRGKRLHKLPVETKLLHTVALPKDKLFFSFQKRPTP
ncbi:cytochrome P450 [Collybia nuda]|uniref:Cytochrome P450 n=1 Tax=Collybia nuda TaxID=64659 RepID=A0A9P5Y6D8_9AGAR|nr:cytochrome P450 [Collybia nuda]